MGKYDRQMMLPGWDQEAVGKSRILVVGAGTTGNEVIKNLVLLGVGEITIVDRDVVERVNLNRSVLFREEDIDKPKSETAAQRARELNPDVKITGCYCDVVYDVGNLKYSAFDCVILTVDNLEARMFVNRGCWLNNTPLIETGVDGLVGNVFVMIPGVGACLECGWSNIEYQRLGERYSCLKKGLLLEERKIPMVITTAAVVGGIAVHECIRVLHRNKSEGASKAGVFLHYDGETGNSLTWLISQKDECPAHVRLPDPLEILLEPSLDETVEEIKRALQSALSTTAVEIRFDREIVYSTICNHCAYRLQIKPCLLGKFRRFRCSSCGLEEMMVPDDQTEELREGFSLKALNVPSDQLLLVVFSRSGKEGLAYLRVR